MFRTKLKFLTWLNIPSNKNVRGGSIWEKGRGVSLSGSLYL